MTYVNSKYNVKSVYEQDGKIYLVIEANIKINNGEVIKTDKLEFCLKKESNLLNCSIIEKSSKTQNKNRQETTTKNSKHYVNLFSSEYAYCAYHIKHDTFYNRKKYCGMVLVCAKNNRVKPIGRTH